MTMRLLFLLSLRNLTHHRVKNFIVGALLSFSAFLWVVGLTLTQNIENEMKRSISSSLTGDLQVYDQDARDPLSLFGGFSVGAPDIGQIPHFERVRDSLLTVPGVQEVVPMGILIGSVTVQGELESALGELREWVWLRKETNGMPTSLHEIPVERVQRALLALREDIERSTKILSKTAMGKTERGALEEVLTPEWWQDFPSEPFAKLEHLDTKIAPSSPAGQMVYLRVLGTDMERFQKSFSRMMVLRGRRMHAGERGMLLNQQFMDEHMKIRALRTFDQIHQSVADERKSIEDSPELQNTVSQLKRQATALVSAVPYEKEQRVRKRLAKIVGDTGTLHEQFVRFFQIDDHNIHSRHSYFYQHIAPLIKVYAFDNGDLVPLTAFTKAGYPRSVNVRIRGVFTFEGLEKSELAGATNLIDLVTFRELYGQPSEEVQQELLDIRTSAGIEVVPRANAEADLFSGTDLERRPSATRPKTLKESDPILIRRKDPDAPFPPEEVETGLALHGAVLLTDDASIREVENKIDQLNKRESLKIQVVDWRSASGLVGQFVVVVRFVIYIALWIILAVAVVMMNNTWVISILDRVNEIGTLRALGAQRAFVRRMTMLESFFLASISAAVGIFAGVFVLYVMRWVGLPAQGNVWIFLFGGPRLHPDISLGPLVSGAILLLFVSQIASLYPAYLATKVTPIIAMQDAQT